MSQSKGEVKGSPLDSIIDILAFFVATRNYSYVDILSNALDELTAREALINALRDYRSTCPQPGMTVERRDIKVRCPSVSHDTLEAAVRIVESRLREAGADLMTFTRSLSLNALARADKFKITNSSEG